MFSRTLWNCSGATFFFAFVDNLNDGFCLGKVTFVKSQLFYSLVKVFKIYLLQNIGFVAGKHIIGDSMTQMRSQLIRQISSVKVWRNFFFLMILVHCQTFWCLFGACLQVEAESFRLTRILKSEIFQVSRLEQMSMCYFVTLLHIIFRCMIKCQCIILKFIPYRHGCTEIILINSVLFTLLHFLKIVLMKSMTIIPLS